MRNIELMEKVIERIEKVPQQFDMNFWWIVNREDTEWRREVWDCGMAACLAGTTCLVVHPEMVPDVGSDGTAAQAWTDKTKSHKFLISSEARDHLGLTNEECEYLFARTSFEDYQVIYVLKRLIEGEDVFIACEDADSLPRPFTKYQVGDVLTHDPAKCGQYDYWKDNPVKTIVDIQGGTVYVFDDGQTQSTESLDSMPYACISVSNPTNNTEVVVSNNSYDDTILGGVSVDAPRAAEVYGIDGYVDGVREAEDDSAVDYTEVRINAYKELAEEDEKRIGELQEEVNAKATRIEELQVQVNTLTEQRDRLQRTVLDYGNDASIIDELAQEYRAEYSLCADGWNHAIDSINDATKIIKLSRATTTRSWVLRVSLEGEGTDESLDQFEAGLEYAVESAINSLFDDHGVENQGVSVRL